MEKLTFEMFISENTIYKGFRFYIDDNREWISNTLHTFIVNRFDNSPQIYLEDADGLYYTTDDLKYLFLYPKNMSKDTKI